MGYCPFIGYKRLIGKNMEGPTYSNRTAPYGAFKFYVTIEAAETVTQSAHKALDMTGATKRFISSSTQSAR